MDKIFVDEGGNVEEYISMPERRRHVRFPVYLSVKYGECPSEVFHDFVLNISRRGLFIKTDLPLPVGSRMVMNIYIPPESKLLGTFHGEVVAVNRDNNTYPAGMHVQFIPGDKEDLKRLEELLEERRHLVDEKI